MGKNVLAVTVLFSALSLAVASPEAMAGQGRGRGHAGKPGKVEKQEKQGKAQKRDTARGTAGVFVVDRNGYVRAIREYRRTESLPPGLAKRESLPPGLERQLRERGELPPGLQKRLVPVPAPLVRRLPPVPAGYERYFVGNDLIVVDRQTNRIAAVVRNVW